MACNKINFYVACNKINFEFVHLKIMFALFCKYCKLKLYTRLQRYWEFKTINKGSKSISFACIVIQVSLFPTLKTRANFTYLSKLLKWQIWCELAYFCKIRNISVTTLVLWWIVCLGKIITTIRIINRICNINYLNHLYYKP